MVATNYAWNPIFDCITEETNDAGAITAEYTQEPRLYGGLISQHRSGTTSIHHYDAIGTTRALTDSGQNVTDTMVYTAFGEKIASTGATVNPFRYLGRIGYYTDITTGILSVGKRSYLPEFARWLSPDPIGYYLALNELFKYLIHKSWKIRIQPLRASGTNCGARQAAWDVFLDKPAPCDGYLIQEVTRSCARIPCPCDFRSIAKAKFGTVTYWEFWEVKNGEIIPDKRLNDKEAQPFTDGFGLNDASGTCGGETMYGNFKFYCKKQEDSPNGEKGTGPAPSGPLKETLCGMPLTSGNLPATKSKPNFWDSPPVAGDGGQHSAERTVVCCPCASNDSGEFVPGVNGGNGWKWP